VHAAILLGKLPHLDEYIARRQALAARYDVILSDTVLTLPTTAAGNTHAFYLYVARHPQRDKIIAELASRDIVVNVSYPWPIHTMRGYEYLGYHQGDLPHTEAAMSEVFSLPMYPSLTEEQQDTVCGALQEILAGMAV
jgi:aminotransferase EvaB